MYSTKQDAIYNDILNLTKQHNVLIYNAIISDIEQTNKKFTKIHFIQTAILEQQFNIIVYSYGIQ